MGVNEPLVLLPGMMCDARLFTAQINHFSGERAVISVPLIGQNSIAALARDVLSQVPQKFALAGLSMGGIVAMEVFRQAPERILRLALMDTNPFADTPDRSAEREAQTERVLTGQLRTVMRDEMKPNYLTDGPNRNRILDLCMAMAETLGARVFQEQSQALQRRTDQQSSLREVRVPTLVLCGEDDVLCPVSHHEKIHSLVPGSRLAIMPGAGHLPTLEQPELTNKEIQLWLNT